MLVWTLCVHPARPISGPALCICSLSSPFLRPSLHPRHWTMRYRPSTHCSSEPQTRPFQTMKMWSMSPSPFSTQMITHHSSRYVDVLSWAVFANCHTHHTLHTCTSTHTPYVHACTLTTLPHTSTPTPNTPHPHTSTLTLTNHALMHPHSSTLTLTLHVSPSHFHSHTHPPHTSLSTHLTLTLPHSLTYAHIYPARLHSVGARGSSSQSCSWNYCCHIQ